MSAFGAKADVNHYGSKGRLIAISGHTATRVRSPKFSKIGLYGTPHEPAVLGLDLHGTEANATAVRKSVHFRLPPEHVANPHPAMAKCSVASLLKYDYPMDLLIGFIVAGVILGLCFGFGPK